LPVDIQLKALKPNSTDVFSYRHLSTTMLHGNTTQNTYTWISVILDLWLVFASVKLAWVNSVHGIWSQNRDHC